MYFLGIETFIPKKYSKGGGQLPPQLKQSTSYLKKETILHIATMHLEFSINIYDLLLQ